MNNMEKRRRSISSASLMSPGKNVAPVHVNDDTTYLTGVAQTHPIVPIALAMNNLETSANLADFVKFEISRAVDHKVSKFLFLFRFCYPETQKRNKF